ncbi:MAG: Rieske 2Fe-2S domain-containing protein, partial [Rhodobacteraceae bacterium]|nr:Rieske 2Fe-2S domain-containing protein [Paracoccaceae bacterium]
MDVEADRDLELVRQAVEGAKGLPNNHYIDQATYEEEREVLLFNNWAGIGLGSDIPNPGDVSPVNFAGMPLLMVRNHEGDIQVFQNTCRHR